MAGQYFGSIDISYVDVRRADPNAGGIVGTNTNFGDVASVNTLRSALNTFDPFTYTAAQMDIMNVNDLVFAWRSCRGNQGSVSNYMPAQTARTS